MRDTVLLFPSFSTPIHKMVIIRILNYGDKLKTLLDNFILDTKITSLYQTLNFPI